LENKFQKKLDKVILPCGILLHQKVEPEISNSIPSWKEDDGKIYMGYVGNLGEAHSVNFLKWTIDSIDPHKHKLILVVYGTYSHIIKDYVNDTHKSIVIVDHIPREQLKHIDLHLVSLKQNFVNLCVPSKLLSAVHKSSVFLFFGPEASDSWQYLKKAGWLIEEGNDALNAIQSFFNALTHEKIANKKKAAADLPAYLEAKTWDGYNGIVELVKKIETEQT